jgi:hypothetical protein
MTVGGAFGFTASGRCTCSLAAGAVGTLATRTAAPHFGHLVLRPAMWSGARSFVAHDGQTTGIGIATTQENRSDVPEPPQQARPRASVKQRPAAAPFGAWLALPLLKHRGKPTFGRFAEVSYPCYAWIGLSTGRIRPACCSGRSLLGTGRKGGIGTYRRLSPGDAKPPEKRSQGANRRPVSRGAA